jgi:hypothetical protein
MTEVELDNGDFVRSNPDDRWPIVVDRFAIWPTTVRPGPRVGFFSGSASIVLRHPSRHVRNVLRPGWLMCAGYRARRLSTDRR